VRNASRGVSWIARVRPVVIAILVLIPLIEVTLQAVRFLRPEHPAFHRFLRLSEPYIGAEEAQWESRFLGRFDHHEGFLDAEGMFLPDPNLGWVVAPNARVTSEGYTYTTNRAGARALHEYSRSPRKYSVLIVGGSFVYGWTLPDEYVWPTLLEKKDPRLTTFNFAVPGYGIDQSLIALRQRISAYRPDLVIFAFTRAMLTQSMLGFRDFKKPRFELSGSELVLRNVPIGGIEEVARGVRTELDSGTPVLSRFVLYNLMRNYFRARAQSAPGKEYALEVNQAILHEAALTARKAGAECWFLHLAYASDVRGNPRPWPQKELREIASRENVPFVDTLPVFQAHPAWFEPGHYHPAEAVAVSDFVYSQLRPLIENWAKQRAGSR
jgi:hypothetical protein